MKTVLAFIGVLLIQVLAIAIVGFILNLLDVKMWFNGYLCGIVAMLIGPYLHDKITLKA